MVSIIIVNYHVKEELFTCISSIVQSKPKIKYEIIVVDNDEVKTIKTELYKKYPQVVYVPNENKGFGQGNNIGVKKAKGDFLFILNPDTRIYKNCLDILVTLFKEDDRVGIAAPLLYHADNTPFALQGLDKLTPFSAVFALSFINKLFPNNPVSKKYWNLTWDKHSIQKVQAVPGTAFVIRRRLFVKLGGFDEHFFLYFEETDLCKRVCDAGLKLVMTPEAKVYHAWGSSTKKSKQNINKIFMQSRFYYFRKHFGLVAALFTESVLRTGKYSLTVFFILILASILRIYNLQKLMILIGDQAWFYISARDMLLTHQVPLFGITASHTWLHQGPLWTYLLAIIFAFTRFNPFAPGYFTVVADVCTVLLLYLISSVMFSRRVGVMAALFYAASPLIILKSRMPYHTSLIPICTLFFVYALYKWVTGNRKYFPLALALLAILYNFELATVVLWVAFFAIFFYGMKTKSSWFERIKDRGVYAATFVALFIPMLPMLLFDFSHRFPQTLKFGLWVLYKIFRFFGFPDIHKHPMSVDIQGFYAYSLMELQRILFLPNGLVALILLAISLIIVFIQIYTSFRKKISTPALCILITCFIVSLAGYIGIMTESDAYLPVFFPLICLLIAQAGGYVARNSLQKAAILLSFLVVATGNMIGLLQTNYFAAEITPTLQDKIAAAQIIVKQTNGREYNLLWSGKRREFATLTMPYEYLAWWLGHAPTAIKAGKKVYIHEENGKIHIAF